MAASKLFIEVCLAEDTAEAVGLLGDARLSELGDYIGLSDHAEGVVGFVQGLITIEAARRFFKRGKLVAETIKANTVAEGMDMAHRGEEF